MLIATVVRCGLGIRSAYLVKEECRLGLACLLRSQKRWRVIEEPADEWEGEEERSDSEQAQA